MASPLFMLRGAFRHPERSEMSDVRSCKGKAVRTESKDLAPHHHFAFLISNFLFKRRFQTESKGSMPRGLTLSPEPLNLTSIIMTILPTLHDLPKDQPFVLGIGFFDGCHLGHQVVFSEV